MRRDSDLPNHLNNLIGRHRRTIWGALLAAPTRNASVNVVMRALDGSESDFAKDDIISILDSVIVEFREKATPHPVVGQVEAMHRLVGEDLSVVRDLLMEHREFWEIPIQQRLQKAFELIQYSFRELGIPIDYAKFQIVDKYPPPYENLAFWAMNYDATDKERYGIEIGTRLRKDVLMPFYSESLLAHELVHACFGKISGTKLARGLEEGLADILGHLVLAARLMPWGICENILLSTRCFQPQTSFWMNYHENLCQGCLILFQHGIPGLISLVSKAQNIGREYIREVESALLNGVSSAVSPLGKQLPPWATLIEPQVRRFCRRFVAFPQSICASPLAYEIARNARLDESVPALCKRLQLDRVQAERAITELHERVFLVVLKDNDTIAFNESKLYIDTASIRYTFIDMQ